MTADSRVPAGRQAIRYTLLAPLRDHEAHFAFDGPFEGETVRWDARLLTLAEAIRTGRAGPETRTRRPFIDIGEATPAGRALTVALDIEQIDEPTLLRTIIMIRQYKRLRTGRHEFGESRRPDAV